MFTNFGVRNFRCFSGLTLKDLSRVNLIAGKNNTGKTALLEAIHLHNNPNNCRLPVLINKQRGIVEPERAFSDVVGWLFYGKRPESGLTLQSWDEKGTTRTLSMYLLDAATARERFPEAVKALADALPAQWYSFLGGIVLRYEQDGEPTRFSWGVPNLIGVGTMSVSGRISWTIPSLYLGSGMPSSEQDVKFFGEVEVAKRQAEILPALQILDKRLQRLALAPLGGELALQFTGPISSGPISSPSLSPGSQAAPGSQAGEPIIHGDIGLPRLIPMPLMGEGMRRVLSIVLAIANAPGGVVLIDEIENGLHYSVQADVWKAIARAARDANVQVFATTHSWECIEAAHHAFKEAGPYEFRYYRLDRRGDEITAKSLDEGMLDAVEKSDLEAR